MGGDIGDTQEAGGDSCGDTGDTQQAGGNPRLSGRARQVGACPAGAVPHEP